LGSRSTVRFAVGRREGPRSNVWVLFTSKKENDVYLSMRSFADLIKVSLHKSDDWRWAFTEEHLSSPSPMLPSSGNRTMDKWERPAEFAPGCVKAFQILVPSSEVTMPEYPEGSLDKYRKKIHWVPRAPENFGTCFTVIFTASEVGPGSWQATAGQQIYQAHPIWHTQLPRDGKYVWVLAHEQPISEIDRKGIEAARQEWNQVFKREAGAMYTVLKDKRAFLYSADANGTRSFIDIAMPS
jgi:hypothetical protein